MHGMAPWVLAQGKGQTQRVTCASKLWVSTNAAVG